MSPLYDFIRFWLLSTKVSYVVDWTVELEVPGVFLKKWTDIDNIFRINPINQKQKFAQSWYSFKDPAKETFRIG